MLVQLVEPEIVAVKIKIRRIARISSQVAEVLHQHESFLLLMIPIPAIIFNPIAFPLQLLSSRFGAWVLGACQIPVLREGNIIQLANTSLEVAEACSGIRSLLSLVTLAIIYGYFLETRVARQALFAVAAVPIAVVAIVVGGIWSALEGKLHRGK